MKPTWSLSKHGILGLAGVVMLAVVPNAAFSDASWGGVPFPWKVFDGSIPDVPFAVAPGMTYFVDPNLGNDSYDGTSFTFVSGAKGPKRSLSAMLKSGRVNAGDTVLLGGGIYREYVDFGSLTGSPGAPITIGSYGRGTGAPILDGGLKSTQWTRYSGEGQTTVWQTPMSGFAQISGKQPVLGVYVNSGSQESALKEVVHGQLTSYGMSALASNPWYYVSNGTIVSYGSPQSNVTDGSNRWFYDPVAKILYADFGGTLGSRNPNPSDVSILYDSHTYSNAQMVLTLTYGHNYFNFVGLTVRASSWGGVYSEASGLTFDHCDVKFNGGHAIAFGPGQIFQNGVWVTDLSVTGNSVLYSRVWMNVLHNWPRFNNGNTSGGWPSALGSMGHISNSLYLGNVVYENGGEGLDISATSSGDNVTPAYSQNNVVKNNVIYDNFSANLYFISTQNGRAEQNFVFDHPLDPGQTFDHLLDVRNQGGGDSAYNGDLSRRLVPFNLGLADEPDSNFDHKAHLSNITVINNVFAGGKRAITSFDDGTADQGFGFKNIALVNNTFVLGDQSIAEAGYTLMIAEARAGNDSGSVVENNIFVTTSSADSFAKVYPSGYTGAGIAMDYNLYSGPGTWGYNGNLGLTFSSWKSMLSSWDGHSLQADAMLTDLSEFNQTVAQKPVYDWSKARLGASSPARGRGLNMGSLLTTDFAGAPRAGGAYDLGALSAGASPTATRTATATTRPTATSTPRPTATPTSTATPTATLTPTSAPVTSFFTLPPCRVVDTRNANGPRGGPALDGNASRAFTLAGACGIPSTAKAVSVNVTVTQPTTAGDLRLYPAGSALPGASVINYGANQTRANNAIAALGTSGGVAVRCDQAAGTTVHFILDVTGYFE